MAGTTKVYQLASFLVENRPRQYEPLFEFIRSASKGKARVIEDGAVIVGGWAQFSLVLEVDNDEARKDLALLLPAGLAGLTGTLRGISGIEVKPVDARSLQAAAWEVDLQLAMDPDPAHFSRLADHFGKWGLAAERMSGRIVASDDPMAEFPVKYEASYSLVPRSGEVRQCDWAKFADELTHARIRVLDLRQRLRPTRSSSSAGPYQPVG